MRTRMCILLLQGTSGPKSKLTNSLKTAYIKALCDKHSHAVLRHYVPSSLNINRQCLIAAPVHNFNKIQYTKNEKYVLGSLHSGWL
jgi:hypothetical protein